MKRHRRLALLVLVLATGVTLADGQGDDKLSANSQAAADARAERVKEEVAEIRGHEWAGEYYEGDGLGENVRLLIAPKSGFVYWWRGCVGLYDMNYGGVEATGGRLKLLFEQPKGSGGLEGIEPELMPVLWGGRHYLIPSRKVLEFANSINAGFEPRKRMHGSFLLRMGDERKAARGAPGVPMEYRGFLLAAPITARVSSLGASRVGKPEGCESRSRVTPVVLDAGSDKGVKVGMEFWVFSPRIYQTVTVTKVQDSSSEGDVVQCVEEAPASTKWRLSTSAGR